MLREQIDAWIAGVSPAPAPTANAAGSHLKQLAPHEAAMRSWFVPILQFWFGDVDALGRSDVLHSRRWFMKDEAFDREIADRFGDTYADVRAGQREAWLDEPRGRVAYVIVLDQFPRNMFRGTARMFEGDRQALAAAVEGVARHDDTDLTVNERSFLYMPFMHSEDIGMQERSVALVQRAGRERAVRAARQRARGRAVRREAPRDHRALRPLPAPQHRPRTREHAGGAGVHRANRAAGFDLDGRSSVRSGPCTRRRWSSPAWSAPGSSRRPARC